MSVSNKHVFDVLVQFENSMKLRFPPQRVGVLREDCELVKRS